MKLSDYDRPKGRYLFYAVKTEVLIPLFFSCGKFRRGNGSPISFLAAGKRREFNVTDFSQPSDIFL